MSALAITRSRWRGVALVAILAVGYYATGRLGLLLAIPPGFATAIWPPSGIALGVLAIFGSRCWPGVLLGSFLLNLGILQQGPNPALGLRTFLLAAGIGVGASLQAAFGAWLLRRFVGLPLELVREREIAQFFCLGGLASCAVNATSSVLLLASAGALPWDDAAFTWWTWWVGDVLGVSVFAPLVFIWSAEPREVWRRRRLVVTLPLALLFGLVILFFIRASALEVWNARIAFDARSSPLASSVRNKLQDSLAVLEDLGDVLATFPDVDRDRFARLVRRSLSRQRGFQAISWNVLVADAGRAALEEEARREGLQGFLVTELGEQGSLVPAGWRPEHVVVRFIEPHPGNEKALGYDVTSDRTRRDALRRASETGRPAATGSLRLIQETGDAEGILVYVPVHRENALRGFVTGVFRVQDLLQAAIDDLPRDHLGIRLYDLDAPPDKRLLWGSPRESPASADFRSETTLDAAGRRWNLVVEGTPAYQIAARSWKPWTALAGGLAFTALLGAFLLAATGRAVVIERMAAEREASLSNANAHLEREINERKLAERTLQEKDKEFQQAQKMEAFGRLAGGVAHDFNNLLTPIIGYANLTLQRLPSGDPLRGELEEIRSSGERAASLTRQLLAFSRKQVLQPRVLDLNMVVSDMEKMLRRLIGEHIDLRTTLAGGLGSVKADPGQIEQVLMNLVVNARDAMPHGGILSLETKPVSVDGSLLGGAPGPCSSVLLSVSDTGTGMDDKALSHLFEPFFTTKERGKGTGLGLSTVYGIVKQSGGHIEVESRTGEGTSVRVYLPRVPDEPRDVPREVPQSVQGGTERILVAEDDDVVRRMITAVLKARGYAIDAAANGQEAFELLERTTPPPNLLLTDIVMPRIGGRELVQHATQLRPDLKVLFISGYAETARMHMAIREDQCFLAKPFTPDALLRKVREVLDSPR